MTGRVHLHIRHHDRDASGHRDRHLCATELPTAALHAAGDRNRRRASLGGCPSTTEREPEMTTRDDIVKAGGKCEVVGTGFWECTDVNGKKWWCDADQCMP